MFIAWFVRGAGVLSGVRRKGWSRLELLDVERRLQCGGLRGMCEGDILVSWGEAGPDDGMRVVPVDGRGVPDKLLDRIESAVRRRYA